MVWKVRTEKVKVLDDTPRKVQVLKRRVICRQRTFRHAEESASVTFRRKTKENKKKKKKVRVKEKSKIRNGEGRNRIRVEK